MLVRGRDQLAFWQHTPTPSMGLWLGHAVGGIDGLRAFG